VSAKKKETSEVPAFKRSRAAGRVTDQLTSERPSELAVAGLEAATRSLEIAEDSEAVAEQLDG
jgi:hypothetical protein